MRPARQKALHALALLCLLLCSACVYRVDVQQGNLLEDTDIDNVKIGMTRSQVRFLLGTPVVDDFFHNNRWDYIYYFRKARDRKPEPRGLIFYFDGDRVRSMARAVPVEPS